MNLPRDSEFTWQASALRKICDQMAKDDADAVARVAQYLKVWPPEADITYLQLQALFELAKCLR